MGGLIHMPKLLRIGCLLVVAVLCSAPVWSQSDEPAVQTWNEILLEAIRNDLARPNVHARNLHHFSTGQYALQLLSEGLDGTAADAAVAWPDAPDGIGTWSPGTIGHRDMMAAYAFRFISLRYAASPDWGETLGLLVNAFIDATGTIPSNALSLELDSRARHGLHPPSVHRRARHQSPWLLRRQEP